MQMRPHLHAPVKMKVHLMASCQTQNLQQMSSLLPLCFLLTFVLPSSTSCVATSVGHFVASLEEALSRKGPLFEWLKLLQRFLLLQSHQSFELGMLTVGVGGSLHRVAWGRFGTAMRGVHSRFARVVILGYGCIVLVDHLTISLDRDC